MVKGKAYRKTWKEARKPTNKRASSRVKSAKRQTFEERTAKKRALEEVKVKQAELLETRKEVRKARHKKRDAKKKRKEENALKNGQYQVIKNTEKIRKWHRNAKKTLKTMSGEQIEALMKGR
uniref:Coiled-coil domain-containing protein 86 n=1 Tax=Strombidinopsis acuminata TaxID=141414 RepID=A0A7S3U7W2_9SPIT